MLLSIVTENEGGYRKRKKHLFTYRTDDRSVTNFNILPSKLIRSVCVPRYI